MKLSILSIVPRGLSRALVATGLGCLVTSAVAVAIPTEQEPKRTPGANSHEIAIGKLVDHYAKYGRLNGAILVSENNRVIYSRGVGMANLEWRIPATPETRFLLASVTKQFTAGAILRLVDQGKIKLQEPIATYLPAYRTDVASKVTVFQLLTHSSGIPDYVSRDFVENHSQTHYGVQEFIQKYCSGDLLFKPGLEYRYSNAGYFLLGAIIEKVTGKSYGAAMQDLVFDPLKMTSSGYANNRAVIPKRAAGYRELLDGYENATYTDMSIPYSAGALYSTVGDIYKWDQGLYSPSFLSAASREAMFTPHLGHYALGWRTDPLPVGSTSETVAAVHHGGNIPGFDTTVIRLREKHDMIVILDNESHRHEIDELSRQIMGILLDKPLASLKPPIGEVMRRDIVRLGITAAVAHYRELKMAKPGSFDYAEGELNTLGYRLMEAQRPAEAVEVMRLNAEAFPDSANAWDSLGEAYLANHQGELAQASYEKSLQLNPQSENARAVLEKMKQSAN